MNSNISVLIASKNAGATLDRCLQSVCIQSKCEVLVADGGSTDRTTQVLSKYEERLAWWRSEQDSGIANAWNKALAKARGEWILFLGADDWLPEADVFARVGPTLEGVASDISIAYGTVRLMTPAGHEVGLAGAPWNLAGPRFRWEMSIPHQGVFHRRELFDRVGVFDESFRIAADYELLLRELIHRPAHFIPDLVVANMQIGGISLHGENILTHVREIRRARERHGVFEFDVHYASKWTRAALRQWGSKVLGRRRAGLVADAVRRMSGRPPIWSVE
jgi:glycosyltransferase involved in cell wall biosynthesis